MGFYRTNPGKLLIVALFLCSINAATYKISWVVFANTARTGFAWVACKKILPDVGALPCIAAALLVGIGATWRAEGGSGYRQTILPTRDLSDTEDDGIPKMYHHVGDKTYNFINTTALTHEWHNVSIPDSEMDLIVRRLPDGRIHTRTQGFSKMGCQSGQCPDELDEPVKRSRIFRRSSYRIQEIEFSWTEDSNFGKGSTDLKNAALGAADFVIKAKAGTHRFCSLASTSYGSKAKIGFNFYTAHYGADYPKACA